MINLLDLMLAMIVGWAWCWPDAAAGWVRSFRAALQKDTDK